MAINPIKSGAIIIAGSGMCSGGRIQHHLKNNIWRPECHLVIVGFQAHGTLGRRIVDGVEKIRFGAGQRFHGDPDSALFGGEANLLKGIGSTLCGLVPIPAFLEVALFGAAPNHDGAIHCSAGAGEVTSEGYRVFLKQWILGG